MEEEQHVQLWRGPATSQKGVFDMLDAKTMPKVPELQTLVSTIIDSVLALAALVARQGELEQRFEFAWGHQSVVSRASSAVCLSMRLVRT